MASDGTVYGLNQQTGEIDQLGNIHLSRFPNPSGLIAAGGKFFASEESGQPTWGKPGSEGLGALRAGGIEASNVNVADEVANQILSVRGAEANLKTVQTADEMLGTMLDMVE